MAKSKSGGKKPKSPKSGQQSFGKSGFAGFQKPGGLNTGATKTPIVQRANRGR